MYHKKENKQAGEKKVVFKNGMNVADLATSMQVANAQVIKKINDVRCDGKY